MKRILSTLLVCVLLVGCVLSFASCSKISESYADKVNEAAEAGEHYTYDQVVEDLGDNAIEVGFSAVKTGVIIAVKGCESIDDIKDKIEDGETIKGIVVVVTLNKAISAEYRVITEDDLKLK